MSSFNSAFTGLHSDFIQIVQNLIFELWNLTVYPAAASTIVLKIVIPPEIYIYQTLTKFLELFASYDAVSNKHLVFI